MSWGRAPAVLLGGGVSLTPPLPVSKFFPGLQHPGPPEGRGGRRADEVFQVLSFWGISLPGAEKPGRRAGVCPSPGAPGVQFPGAVVGTLSPPLPCSQATLLLSFLWMPALLPVASRLRLLPRALLSMASGSPPSQPSPASGSGYVPGSVSAAFVTCPNEKVAKEIARWGGLGRVTQRGERAGARGRVLPRGWLCPWAARAAPGWAHSERALD